jgi:hypothetical protein
MSHLKPWADGAFDLILHAEICFRKGTDFDRRIALISFDNAIEVAITTYLNLHPVQRKSVTLQREEVARWLANFHTKLDFLFDKFIPENACLISFGKDELVWCHETRNGQYHGAGPTIPRARELEVIRKAALEIFAMLFDIEDVDGLLEERLAELDPNRDLPQKDLDGDRLIDSVFGMVNVAGQNYYTSEILFSVDPFAYGNVLAELKADPAINEEQVTTELWQ